LLTSISVSFSVLCFLSKKFVLVTVNNTVRVRVSSRVRVRLGLGSGLQLGFRVQGSSSELVT